MDAVDATSYDQRDREKGNHKWFWNGRTNSAGAMVVAVIAVVAKSGAPGRVVDEALGVAADTKRFG
jgi:hypothetical protein